MGDRALGEAEFWERRADAWDRRVDVLNRFADAYGVAAMDALAPAPGERVLDVGCGPGTTAVELARRVGHDGEVVGLDIAEAMVAAASRRAGAAGAANLRFVVHDLETAPLADAFDAAYSRFGVMFFPDPPSAFANLAASLRPGGRLGCAVWGALADNPWMFVPTLAAGGLLHADLAIPGPGEPGPFSLAQVDHLIALLEGAGFSEVGVVTTSGSVAITEASIDEDVRTLLAVGPLGEAWDAADEATQHAAVEAVVAAIEPFREGDVWRLHGSANVVTAHRAD